MSKELEYFQEIIKVDKEALTLANKEKSKKRDVMLHRQWLNKRKINIEAALIEHEQYKAIEEELGIDLITLFMALKNGIYVKQMNDFITDYAGHLLSFQGDCFVVGGGYDTFCLLLQRLRKNLEFR